MRTILLVLALGVIGLLISCIVEKEYPATYKYLNQTDKEIVVEAHNRSIAHLLDSFSIPAMSEIIFTYEYETSFLARGDVDSVSIIFNRAKYISYSCGNLGCADSSRNILLTFEYTAIQGSNTYMYYITEEDYENSIPLPK